MTEVHPMKHRESHPQVSFEISAATPGLGPKELLGPRSPSLAMTEGTPPFIIHFYASSRARHPMLPLEPPSTPRSSAPAVHGLASGRPSPLCFSWSGLDCQQSHTQKATSQGVNGVLTLGSEVLLCPPFNHPPTQRG